MLVFLIDYFYYDKALGKREFSQEFIKNDSQFDKYFNYNLFIVAKVLPFKIKQRIIKNLSNFVGYLIAIFHDKEIYL